MPFPTPLQARWNPQWYDSRTEVLLNIEPQAQGSAKAKEWVPDGGQQAHLAPL